MKEERASQLCSVLFTNRTIQQSVAIRDYFTRIYNKTNSTISQFFPIFKVPHTSCFHKLFCPTRTGKLVQSNIYTSIASGPGGAMLLMRLCIYRGFKYAIIAKVASKVNANREVMLI